MCFSATASFVVAGVAGAAGVACLMRAKRPRDLLLAAAPAFFGVQQAVEGLLWLALAQAPDTPASGALADVFVMFAKAFWPIYAPFAVWLAERHERRRMFMLPWLAAGVGVGAHLLLDVLHRPHTAVILDGHISYLSDYNLTPLVALAYLGATTVPLILSSDRALAGLGMVVLIACSVAFGLFPTSVLSVWCFFAAAASGLIFFHFQQADSRRLTVPAPSA